MMQCKPTNVLSCVIFMLFAFNATAAPPPPNITQCKSKWILGVGAPVNFGSFSLNSGSGTLTMDAAGAIGPSATITLSSITAASSTFSFTATNSKSATVCGTHGFTLSWSVPPAPLVGPAGSTAMPVNVLMTAVDNGGTTLVSNVDIATPQTLNTNNLPVTLTFHGVLTTGAFQQTAGLYTSPIFTADLEQGGTIYSSNTTATATSLTPLGITQTVSMNFGTIAGGGLAGTVILDALGGRTVTGDGQMLAVGPGTAASFEITGEANLTYALLITGPAVLENASGQQVTVTNFINSSSGTLPGTGIEAFQVGATLNLAPLQPPGNPYSTTIGAGSPYTVTVNYN